MTRRWFAGLLPALVGATALSWFGISGPAAAADAAKAPITFLTAAILSGPFKVTDSQNLAGVQFAVEQINAEGGINGHPIKLDVIDTELSAAAARRKATDAILRNHASMIIGVTGSDVLRALVAVGQHYHVPIISFAGEDDALTGSEFQPALFRVAASTAMHSAAVVYALKQTYPQVRRVFLLNQDYSFGRASAEGFKKALARIDPDVQVVGNVFHPRGSANFSPYLQQIQASGADFVLTSDWGADLVQFVNQANSFGLKPRIGGTYLADPDILRGVDTAAIGDIGADVYLPNVESPKNDAFIAAWHAAHANTDLPWPTSSVGKSYISTKLAALAITRAGSTDFDKVVHALEGLQYTSIAGPLTVRACDHQVQIGEAIGEVVAGPNKFYSFPYLGKATIAPLSAIGVPPDQTGNARCKAVQG